MKSKKMDLSYTDLTSLPAEIGNLKNLTSLDLSSNFLKILPDEIGNLTNLTYLNLMDNPISEEEKEKIQEWLPNCEIDFN